MFSGMTFTFLAELTDNNNREWFEANKPRYETHVREPALEFIAAMAPALAEFAPHFRAEPRKMGGSLMRVFRDTRFSRDKTPYKTNVGIQFRHALGKDVHAPGFYLHIANDGCFLGVGCWHPEADVLGRIRERIAEDPARWLAVRDDPAFRALWALSGDSLARPPRGYAAEHPVIEDLKRKDFIALAALSPAEVTGPDLVGLASSRFSAATRLMAFLCAAVGVAY
jgi:uncharacterized protein (TIGR02453 family)